MAVYQVVRVFEVERIYSVEAPSEEEALAHPETWHEDEEITRDVVTTEITEIDNDK